MYLTDGSEYTTMRDAELRKKWLVKLAISPSHTIHMYGKLKLAPSPLWSRRPGATRGVTVSMSAFLACHQCYCACSSLVWGLKRLNLRAVVCGIFLKLVAQGFSPGSPVFSPPSSV